MLGVYIRVKPGLRVARNPNNSCLSKNGTARQVHDRYRLENGICSCDTADVHTFTFTKQECTLIKEFAVHQFGNALLAVKGLHGR